MVRLSIYNEKGGVGKTTITAMLASYLAYAHGKSVCVLDFDYPSYHFMELRQSEMRLADDPKSPLSWWLRINPSQAEPFDIFSFPAGKDIQFSVGKTHLATQVMSSVTLRTSFPTATITSSSISREGSLPASPSLSSPRTATSISWQSRWTPTRSPVGAPSWWLTPSSSRASRSLSSGTGSPFGKPKGTVGASDVGRNRFSRGEWT